MTCHQPPLGVSIVAPPRSRAPPPQILNSPIRWCFFISKHQSIHEHLKKEEEHLNVPEGMDQCLTNVSEEFWSISESVPLSFSVRATFGSTFSKRW